MAALARFGRLSPDRIGGRGGLPLTRMAHATTGLRASLLVASVVALAGCSDPEDDLEPVVREPAPRERPAAGEPSPHQASTAPRRARTPGYRAFVALEGEGRLAILGGPPWRVLDTVALPANPHNVAADPAGRHVAVSSPPSGSVTILDGRGRVTARPEVGAGAHDVAFTPGGRRLWVSAEDSGRLVKVSAPDGRVVGSRATTGPPHDLVVSPGGELWATLDSTSQVEVRSAKDGRLLSRPTLDPAPHDIELDPGGRRAWFSNWSSPLLTVASLPRRKPLGELDAGGERHHFAFGAGSLWASDNAGGELLRIDPDANSVRERIPVGPGPHHVAVAGRQVLVAVHGTGELAVVSAEGQLERTLDVGAGPHGVAVLPR